ncbi:sigma-70 family RNA polymerase sigma factor [bacterium SCSIO 12741]|nr:sigma-70 family RNA polymerase sigma factor [bacterium SCSIO 12741]
MKHTIFQLKEAFAGSRTERYVVLRSLYKSHFSPVRKMVTSNGDTEENAHQVFEEAIIALYEQVRTTPEKFEGNPDMRAYLYTLSRDIWEAKNNRKVQINTMVSKEISVSPINRLLDKNNRSVLKLIWGQLKEDCHQVLMGYYFDHFSPSEIGRRTDLGNQETIEQRLDRCFNYLKEMIKRAELRER